MDNIEKYVESMFKDLPKTKSVEKVKNNIISAMEEKYSDLVKSGVSEKEALESVISQFGDIEELKSEFDLESEPETLLNETKTNKDIKFSFIYQNIMQVALVIYLIIGFLTNVWHPTWLVFLLAILVKQGIGMHNENMEK